MKNENIVIVSPSKSFTNQAVHVMEELKLHFPILHASGGNYFENIQQMVENNQVYAIITRGYNVQFLREKLSIPIVDVRYTFEDIYHSFQHALQFSKKVAFISTDVAHDRAKTFQAMTNHSMTIPKVNSLQEIPISVQKLINEGIEVFIGGRATEAAAKTFGAHSVDILVEESSIKTALTEAIHLVQLAKEKQRNQSFIDAILETTENGLIAVSLDAEITFVNQKARSYFGEELDTFVRTTLMNLILEATESNYNLINQLVTVHHQNFILNISPITIDFETTGYLASLEKLDELQVKEGDVRNKLSVKINAARRSFDDLIGSSSTLQQTIQIAKKYARTESVVLINGESGTGKELFAQSLHNESLRKNEPFIAINCAALSESVLESELFGYVKGAFTGAANDGKAGLFEAAHKGTIFLDEIGEISLSFQAKLLRVLQEKEVTRIGDTKSIPVDVRIISATNRNLIKMVEQGDFREDLYYRLDVLNLKIPPLRERRSDIKELVLYFLNKTKKPLKISSSAIQLLTAYEFPGNIRQLENIVERLIVLCENATIDDKLTRTIIASEPQLKKQIEFFPSSTSLPEAERELITRTLIRFNNNKTLTAKELQISKSTLWRKIKLYQLE
ncbi:sigma 54-interacting transcriptional regulator [Candidatus Enterococcus ferrettii]|uniref:Uncharacterized protein n=1 Tax=Candidatus Enterococcus ferrettii TaxID=2815324 RepID=A0ABV0EYF6_9ENTE|nr:sigma 54-interacting transcriptional regulator [Enterococcus sp. 665A]MBO1339408.1 sigma 54-interacting transcriptional regulator [Enterococcus sp. 665A]